MLLVFENLRANKYVLFIYLLTVLSSTISIVRGLNPLLSCNGIITRIGLLQSSAVICSTIIFSYSLLTLNTYIT